MTTTKHDGVPVEILEHGLDAAFLTHPDGRIFYANPAASTLFGYTLHEFQQVGCSGILDADDPHLAQSLERRQRTGRFLGVLSMVRKDGSRFLAEISSALFTNAQGEPRASTFLRDITVRERREEALRAANEALNKALSEVRELRGILPICSYCKSIRDDENYWQKVEAYFSSQTLVEFSHAICPDCYDQHVKPQFGS